MVKQKRRRFSASFKAKVALAAARGDRTLSELGTQFDVHPNLIAQWKKQLIENADHLFSKTAAQRSAWTARAGGSTTALSNGCGGA